MSDEHNGDIKRFLRYLNEEYQRDYDNDIDYSILIEDEKVDNRYYTDIKNAISKINSYDPQEGSYEFKSGFLAGLSFTLEILENIIDKNGPEI